MADGRGKLEEVVLAAAERVKVVILKQESASSASLPVKPKSIGYFTDYIDGVPVPRVLGVGFVPLAPRRVVDGLFCGQERRAEWNPAFETNTVIDQWESADGKKRFCLFHETLHGMLGGIISPRDFVEMRVSWHDADTGRSWVAFVSVDDPRAPAAGSNGFTRGTNHGSGSMARCIAAEDPGKSTLVCSVVHVSPNGSIPNWLVNKGVTGELHSFFTSVSSVFK